MSDPMFDARPDHRRTVAAACMSPAARRRPNPAAAVAIGVLAGVMAGAVASPACASTASASPAATRAEPPRTARGTTGAFDVESAVPLRAKALRDAASPVLVRVNPLGGDRYRVEYLGTVEGAFDLAPLVERADGRAATGLPDLRVEIFTQLPPNHGTDVFGLSAPGFSLSAHYTTALAAVAAAWLAVPAYLLVRRLTRRRPAPPPPPARAVTVAERLFAIVDAARARELGIDERGRLELLMLQELRAHAAADHAAANHAAANSAGSDRTSTLASLADATIALRDDPHTARIVRAVEAWLHAPTTGDRTRALEEIDALRLRPAVAPAGPGEGAGSRAGGRA